MRYSSHVSWARKRKVPLSLLGGRQLLAQIQYDTSRCFRRATRHCVVRLHGCVRRRCHAAHTTTRDRSAFCSAGVDGSPTEGSQSCAAHLLMCFTKAVRPRRQRCRSSGRSSVGDGTMCVGAGSPQTTENSSRRHFPSFLSASVVRMVSRRELIPSVRVG